MNVGMANAQIYESGLLVKIDAARAQTEAEKAAWEKAVGKVTVIDSAGGNRKADRIAEDGETEGQVQKSERDDGILRRTVTPKRPHRFYGTVKLDTSRVGRDAGRIAEEIIQHLSLLNGSEMEVTLEVQARVSPGVPEDVERVEQPSLRSQSKSTCVGKQCRRPASGSRIFLETPFRLLLCRTFPSKRRTTI